MLAMPWFVFAAICFGLPEDTEDERYFKRWRSSWKYIQIYLNGYYRYNAKIVSRKQESAGCLENILGAFRDIDLFQWPI